MLFNTVFIFIQFPFFFFLPKPLYFQRTSTLLGCCSFETIKKEGKFWTVLCCLLYKTWYTFLFVCLSIWWDEDTGHLCRACCLFETCFFDTYTRLFYFWESNIIIITLFYSTTRSLPYKQPTRTLFSFVRLVFFSIPHCFLCCVLHVLPFFPTPLSFFSPSQSRGWHPVCINSVPYCNK